MFQNKMVIFLLGWFGCGLVLFVALISGGAAFMLNNDESGLATFGTIVGAIAAVLCVLAIPMIIYKTYKAMRTKRVR
ncbi:hypothetical protein VITU102760_24985 [Vibrio tubiashii]|uniref:Uncharacterized protein n=1 Tax=Vibrio tubiashii ATCC 19109 TaxID=1051646 RepID=F9T6P4_9VIBR|nr:hypothetical protein [Vibrio tubiashii]AIW17520.1 hypothetical protein IX91_26035 [Vibrio tubiashii ATCC 19109]EGU54449.1 hypothetical protein VITU9109_02707 [Vibrio tubiashii ATCC 19109]EIF01291.1 hypothetical protein VT1337_24435 [Vibrio tubiashii NCIMB 1337 = ATCC 19106]